MSEVTHRITIPQLCLVVLIGPSGSGKSTFARKHFKPTEILSSDSCRGLVADDENDQTATRDAFEVLHVIAGKRLAAGRLTVIDATNVQAEARAPLVALAKEHDALPVALVLKVDESCCQERNRQRPDRAFGPHVIRQQCQQLRRSLGGLQKEGFRYVHVLSSPEQIEAVTIERTRLWTDLRHEHGPFDLIGDVHGCFDELVELLGQLGYQVTADAEAPFGFAVQAPPADPAPPAAPLPVAASVQSASPAPSPAPTRRLIFLGDLVDRGPSIPDVLRLVMSACESGIALTVPGNHDMKLLRKLRGKDVQITHGLQQSLEQLEMEPKEFVAEVARFLDGLVGHYVLDGGKLVVAHAGMKERYQGRSSARVREFALFGETTGETDEFGLPIRYPWAAEYRGPALVVYGHTPVPEPEWLNRTINIDTGCVFGGKLTALRYPERELVSVPAKQTCSQPAKPFLPPPEAAAALSAQQQHDDVLDLADVLGKRIIGTKLHHNVTIRAENATAALEVMSRFAANPRWLIYLPPTTSPCETSNEPGCLEHPAQAFAYFRHAGVPRVICEEKHMGSRAVVIVCRDEDAARQRFGVADEGIGICYTRTGRRFFEDRKVEAQLLGHVHAAITAAGWWERYTSDWFCLDCELMPWSAKALDLLRNQYAAVGAAARAAMAEVTAVLTQAAGRAWPEGGAAATTLLEEHQRRQTNVHDYVAAYRRYCWPVNSIADLKLAPFHLLASEGKVHTDQDHAWHMRTLAELCPPANPAGSILLATATHLVDVTDQASEAAGVRWWEELTARGGEGMVVKPLTFVARSRRGLVQPAVKCRGRDYLRIIYGPEYTRPQHLDRLRHRGLGHKRSLALREFALGLEALDRFVRREPLRRVHECVFGVLALESEPVDPRL